MLQCLIVWCDGNDAEETIKARCFPFQGRLVDKRVCVHRVRQHRDESHECQLCRNAAVRSGSQTESPLLGTSHPQPCRMGQTPIVGRDWSTPLCAGELSTRGELGPVEHLRPRGAAVAHPVAGRVVQQWSMGVGKAATFGASQIGLGEGRSVPVKPVASRMSFLETGICSSKDRRRLCISGPPEDLYIFLVFFASLLPNPSAGRCSTNTLYICWVFVKI